MSVQILNYKDVIDKPNTMAEFDVYVPAIQTTYHMVKLIKTKKGGLMVSFPAKCEKTEDGKFIFHPYVTLSKTIHEDFQKAVLQEVKPHLPQGYNF